MYRAILDFIRRNNNAFGKAKSYRLQKNSHQKGRQGNSDQYLYSAFNQPKTPKEKKIRYFLAKEEQYIPVPLKYQRYCPQSEGYGGRQTGGSGGEKDPDHTKEDCSNETKCLNSQQNHPTFSRSCIIYKRERKIKDIKYRKNVSFLEAKKTVDLCMKENACATVAQKTNLINNNHADKYKFLVIKLIPLGASDWPVPRTTVRNVFSCNETKRNHNKYSATSLKYP